MKFSVVLLASILTFSGQAHALDCAKASANLEKFICADQEIKKADNVMSAAYVALVRKVQNKNFLEALTKSQRRWLAKRDEVGAHKLTVPDSEDLIMATKLFLLKVTNDRLDILKSDAPVSYTHLTLPTIYSV